MVKMLKKRIKRADAGDKEADDPLVDGVQELSKKRSDHATGIHTIVNGLAKKITTEELAELFTAKELAETLRDEELAQKIESKELEKKIVERQTRERGGELALCTDVADGKWITDTTGIETRVLDSEEEIFTTEIPPAYRLEIWLKRKDLDENLIQKIEQHFGDHCQELEVAVYPDSPQNASWYSSNDTPPEEIEDNDADHLFELINTATPPTGYKITIEGVLWKNDHGEYETISKTPILLDAFTMDENRAEWQAILKGRDLGGKTREIALDRSKLRDAEVCIDELLNLGFDVAYGYEQQFQRYLNDFALDR